MCNILFLFIGTYSQDDVDDLLVESIKMKQLNNSNVMSLEGVCLDAGPAPFIVLPYMAGMCCYGYDICILFRKINGYMYSSYSKCSYNFLHLL